MLEIFNEPHADAAQLPLGSSPWPMVIIIAGYLAIVLGMGRKFMERREPFKMNGVLRCYNLFQILYNLVMLLTGYYFMFIERPYNFRCIRVLPEDHDLKDWERTISYAYYINKFVDLLDTIFIVLRKKYNQITFLHVIHHVMMPSVGYLVIRFHGYGGQVFFLLSFNVLVHIAMYCYYYTAAGKQLQKILWWKKYLTMLQMFQFLVIFLHCVYTGLQSNCEASRGVIYVASTASAVMFVLFSNFYFHAYLRARKSPNIEDKTE